ncbi:hypothetical protein FA13DRAFT_644396 [Coprinellus micaceus]|uniref:Uncharacterized protein n=1 Tax=Coprinellus micaceus TaxID=71717 RepID=A0A4Y7T5T3_COPMI|nr:hypothetical protein FA13DRAFT_644396 [Coprinellus micaceus]
MLTGSSSVGPVFCLIIASMGQVLERSSQAWARFSQVLRAPSREVGCPESASSRGVSGQRPDQVFFVVNGGVQLHTQPLSQPLNVESPPSLQPTF